MKKILCKSRFREKDFQYDYRIEHGCGTTLVSFRHSRTTLTWNCISVLIKQFQSQACRSRLLYAKIEACKSPPQRDRIVILIPILIYETQGYYPRYNTLWLNGRFFFIVGCACCRKHFPPSRQLFNTLLLFELFNSYNAKGLKD